jgi:threonine/homoserine/homoserine lactone efflux protein
VDISRHNIKIAVVKIKPFFFLLFLQLKMSDAKEAKEAKESKEPGIGPGRRKTVRKGMFSKDCKLLNPHLSITFN